MSQSFSAAPFFAGAWAALKHRRIGMNVPVALGLAVTFVASTAAMVDPQGPLGSDVYFDSLTMFVAFLIGARWFETRARHRADPSAHSHETSSATYECAASEAATGTLA